MGGFAKTGSGCSKLGGWWLVRKHVFLWHGKQMRTEAGDLKHLDARPDAVGLPGLEFHPWSMQTSTLAPSKEPRTTGRSLVTCLRLISVK